MSGGKGLEFGLGLRTTHYSTILETSPPIHWFEIISENFMMPGGKPLYILAESASSIHWLLMEFHYLLGVLILLNWDYLKQLKTLIARINPVRVSNYLCWTGVSGLNMHDLLPLPVYRRSLKSCCETN